MRVSQTIVISSAGMGSRLGIGSTKALIDIDGKPLILRQLELLRDYGDVRVVVGYQAQQVIDTVRAYRPDVLFVYNHEYRATGTAGSLRRGAAFANEYVVSLDGDLLVRPEDLEAFLERDEECLGGGEPTTDEPVYLRTEQREDGIYATAFSRQSGQYEWTGLVKVKSSRLGQGDQHVYQLLEPLLPLKMHLVHTREIDTMDDYERAVQWMKRGFL